MRSPSFGGWASPSARASCRSRRARAAGRYAADGGARGGIRSRTRRLRGRSRARARWWRPAPASSARRTPRPGAPRGGCVPARRRRLRGVGRPSRGRACRRRQERRCGRGRRDPGPGAQRRRDGRGRHLPRGAPPLALSGGQARTFVGRAGTGDLVATALAPTSRNRTAGELLAPGVPAAEIPGRVGQAVEALETVSLLARAIEQAGLEAPVTRARTPDQRLATARRLGGARARQAARARPLSRRPHRTAAPAGYLVGASAGVAPARAPSRRRASPGARKRPGRRGLSGLSLSIQ